MDASVLNVDIIAQHIASAHPAAYWRCVQLCRATYEALKPSRKQLQNLWLEFVEGKISNRYEDITYVQQYWKNPNGEYQGVFRIVREKGYHTVFAGIFDNGVPNGQFVKYDNNMKLVFDATYSKGVLHGPYMKIIHEDAGIYTIKCNYVDGKLHGRYVRLLKDNHKRYECTYDMGKKNGIEYDYYSDEMVHTACCYVDDKLHGWRYTHSMSGHMLTAELFHNGAEIVVLTGTQAALTAKLSPYPEFIVYETHN
ncbi:MORN-repeat protein [Faustovirus]|nr:MORN-repeat protein [Faustovirus]